LDNLASNLFNPLSSSLNNLSENEETFKASPKNRRYYIAYILLTSAVLVVFLLELMRGAVDIPLGGVVAGLIGTGTIDPSWITIIWELRLPRATTAALAGAGLAASGLLLQTLFRNPLAGPWVLGMTAGAQVGVALVVVTTGTVAFNFLSSINWFSQLSMAAGAYVGAAMAIIIMGLASKYLNTISLLILGLMLGFLGQGIVNVLLHFTNEPQAKVYESWDSGSYSGVSWQQLPIIFIAVFAGLIFSFLLSKRLNALLLGDHYARSLGVRVVQSRYFVMGIVIMVVGAITSYCGPITFIDVIVPHICRGLFQTSDHRYLLPGTILVGALLGLIGDFIATAPWEHHFLHVNSVNAIIGAPVIIYAIIKQKRFNN
jgi:iron complex transport system permease protein